MKTNPSTWIIGIAVVLGLAALWFASHRWANSKTAPISETGKKLASSPPPSTPPPPLGHYLLRHAIAVAKRAEGVLAYVNGSNVPINYYGKVVDQDEHPIEGVTVHYGIETMYAGPFLPGAKFTYFDVVTDAGGLFSISGYKGMGVAIESLTKDGYLYVQKGSRSATYSGRGDGNYRPDPRAREIFTMMKSGAVDPLIHYQARLLIPCDGTPLRVGMMTGQSSPEGDLQFMLTREPYNIGTDGARFSWSLHIQVLGGGLAILNENETYRAPKDGYDPEFVFSKSAKDPHWGSGIMRSFYVKTRDGCFGRINLDLEADYQPPPAKGNVEAFINAKPGARSLEYDPQQRVAKKTSTSE